MSPSATTWPTFSAPDAGSLTNRARCRTLIQVLSQVLAWWDRLAIAGPRPGRMAQTSTARATDRDLGVEWRSQHREGTPMTAHLPERSRLVAKAVLDAGLDVEVRELSASTRTAREAADALGCDVGAIEFTEALFRNGFEN